MKRPTYYSQNIPQRIQRPVFRQNEQQLLFEMTTSKALLFTNLTIKIYTTRIALEYKPFFSSSEHRLTYSAVDVGDIYIKKSRRKSVVGSHRVNSSERLFEIKGLTHDEAEDLKEALDTMLSYRFMNMPIYQSAYQTRFQPGVQSSSR